MSYVMSCGQAAAIINLFALDAKLLISFDITQNFFHPSSHNIIQPKWFNIKSGFAEFSLHLPFLKRAAKGRHLLHVLKPKSSSSVGKF